MVEELDVRSQYLPALLEWDTEFFGFRIQKLVLSEGVSHQDLIAAAREADCTYLFSANASENLCQLITTVGGKSFGSNVNYEKKVAPIDGVMSDEIISVNYVTPEILSLAYEGGWNSRFLKDERFAGQFKRLYAKWVENDMHSGEVLVFLDCHQAPAGLITYRIQNEVARIGILAVRGDMRHQGIAKRLLQVVESKVAKQHPGIGMTVTTQGGNSPARTIYEGY